MVSNEIKSWEQYLTHEDYLYLVEYIENIKNNISNNKMIILYGPGRTGKSTLIKHINSFLKDELCEPCLSSFTSELIFNESIKPLVFLIDIENMKNSKQNNQAIINLIKYKQSFIADVNNIERVNKNLLEHSKIITMNHVFL